MKRIALLGFGTVGAGVYKIFTENASTIAHREQMEFEITRVLIKDFESEPNLALAPREIFATDINAIADDPKIDIVVECMGGIQPAREYILKVLKSGKTVVTSNKEVLAKFWWELEAAAKEGGAGLYYEATVGGGIPIIRTVNDAMQANKITKVMGIINGTTNYILTKMAEEGSSFDDVLKEAQRLGYAEANPQSDVEGYDVTYKLSILSSIAFHAKLPIECIYREGITKIAPEDIDAANELGYVIKLLAIGKRHGQSFEARVHPTMLPKNHPLASVRGVFNAIFLNGHAVDDIMLYGRGAGQMPTASAVVSDVIYAAHKSVHSYATFKNQPNLPDDAEILTDFECGYYLRVSVADEPGVLAKLASVLGDEGVSIRSVVQKASDGKSAQVVFVTHLARELSVQSALKRLEKLDAVNAIESLIRVEDENNK